MVVGINGVGFVGYHLWVYLNYKSHIDVIRLSKEPTHTELKKCVTIPTDNYWCRLSYVLG